MTKYKISITLDQEFIGLIDAMVDKVKLRNRSHAIETLLARSLNINQLNTAYILAGGKESRLTPRSGLAPKSMIKINGQPILIHILNWLKKYRINNVIISVGPSAEKIIKMLGDGKKFGITINYLRETKPLGTGGGLKLLKKRITRPFLIISGNVLCGFDIYDFFRFHQNCHGIATNALIAVQNISGYGSVVLKGARIRKYIEKPKIGKEPSHLANSAVWLAEPTIFNYLPKKNVFSLEKKVLPRLIKENKLFGYIFEGQWFAMDNYLTYRQAQKRFKN